MTLALPAQAGQRVWVALAEEGGAYAEAAEALRSTLGDANDLTIAHSRVLFDEKGPPPDLVVTIGAAAFDESLRHLKGRGTGWERVPVLATLLPRLAYDSNVERRQAGPRPISAVLLDQPLKRQMALLKRALPERRRLGVLLGLQTGDLLPALQREARGAGFSLASQSVAAREEIYPVLKQVLDESDVLLAVPEPDIYNATTLQHILLTTYRGRVPVVAFSAAYVKAGAVLALYSTPAQVMQRAGEMILNWQAGRGLPSPQSPRDFSVAINPRVAASLGLSLDTSADIEKDLRRLEGLK
jgi:hypothetical protein